MPWYEVRVWPFNIPLIDVLMLAVLGSAFVAIIVAWVFIFARAL